MGSKKSETTSQVTIPGITGQERQARDLMMRMAQQGAGQLGDLSGLASGQLQLSPQDAELLRQIQQLSGETARNEMRSNAEMIGSQIEDQLLARNVGGASIEAVQSAMIGRQLQQSLDQSSLQGQIATAQGALALPTQRAQTQMSANQLLLNRILGNASTVGQMGLNERLVQTKQTNTAKESGGTFGTLANLGGRIGAAALTGGGSEVARGFSGSPSMLVDSYRNPQNYTTDIYGD